MRKIFAFLCALLLAVQFSAAQRTLYVIDKDGKLVYYSAASISFSDDMFSFTNGEVTEEVTKESFCASFQVKFKSNKIKSLEQTLEVGVCYSETNENITIQSGRRILGSSLGIYSFTLSSLLSGTTYYWRPYVKVDNLVWYGDVGEVTTLETIINGHKFVDLGLPSGLLWAETNIGAATAADDGNYYAWGETTTKSNYTWSTYKYGTSYNITKYNSTDGKTVLENADDAAYVNWGSSCRMPTMEEFEEIISSDNCTWTKSSKSNSSGSSVNGYRVTSKKNGNSIFFPLSGYRYGDYLDQHGSDGSYWSSTLDTSGDRYAYCLGSGRYTDYNTRCYGSTVRPVAEP